MKTLTLKEILNMVLDHRDDIDALLLNKRPRELRDCSWIFTDRNVAYGSNQALSTLAHKLQGMIEDEENMQGGD